MDSNNDLYIMKGGKVTGPYSVDELVGWIEAGRASPTMDVCVVGSSDWMPLGVHSPARVAEAAANVMAKQQKARHLTQVGLLLSGCVVVGVLVWGWLAVTDARRAKEELATVAEAAQGKETVLTESQTRLRATSEQASTAEGRAKKLEAELVKADAAAREALKKSEETAKRLADREMELAKKDGELAATTAEIDAKTRRIKQVEDVAVKYADRLARWATVLVKSTEIPRDVMVTISHSGSGPIDWGDIAIKAAIEREFTRNGFRIVETQPRSGDVVSVKFLLFQDSQPSGIYYRANFYCSLGGFRGLVWSAPTIHYDGYFGFTGGRRSPDWTAIQSLIDRAAKKSVNALNDLKVKGESELTKMDPTNVYRDLIAAGLSGQRAKKGDEDAAVVASGSGVVIARRPLILTNHHVIKEAKRIVVNFADLSEGKEAVVLFSDSNRDIAVLGLIERLGVFGEVVMPAVAENEEVKTGTEVFSLGFPLVSMLGKEVKYSAGSVSALTGIQGTRGRFQLSVPTQPGNSGGPVFLKDGVFCGLMVSTLNPFYVAKGADALPQNVNYAVDVGTIRSFLTEHGLWAEVNGEKRDRLQIEQAKRLTVRIEVE